MITFLKGMEIEAQEAKISPTTRDDLWKNPGHTPVFLFFFLVVDVQYIICYKCAI